MRERSERAHWRKKVRNWERRIAQTEQGLDDSKVSAQDIVGERPIFQPSEDYIKEIASHASNLRVKLAKGGMSSRKLARMEAQLSHLETILQGRQPSQPTGFN